VHQTNTTINDVLKVANNTLAKHAESIRILFIVLLAMRADIFLEFYIEGFVGKFVDEHLWTRVVFVFKTEI
jgi:hypothetical protein